METSLSTTTAAATRTRSVWKKESRTDKAGVEVGVEAAGPGLGEHRELTGLRSSRGR